MKRVLHTAFALALIMVMFLGMVPTAQAATDTSMSLNIPIQITTGDSKPVAGAYALFLVEAVDGAPLPGGETSILHLTYLNPVNGVTSDVIHFEASELGVYTYKIQMVDGTYYDASADSMVYYVDAYNFNETQDDHYEIYDGSYGENHKYSVLAYNWPLMDVVVAKKWIDQASVRPSSITAELLLNGERPTVKVNGGEIAGYEDLLINSSWGWQRKWEGVDARKATYSVKEVKVPAGYVPSYSMKDGVYVITNTGALIQTGQLNWPIPVLCGAGCLFLLAGMLMLRRKEENNA